MKSAQSSTAVEAWRIQRRVIGALVMREIITRFGRNNLGVLWLIVEPMLFTLGVAALWSATGLHHASTLPVVAFAITGYSSVLVWRNCATRASGAIDANKALLYHRQVRLIDLLSARILLEIGGATTSFVVLAGAFTYAGLMAPPIDLFSVLAGWLALIWFGTGLGFMIGASVVYSHVIEKIWHPASYLLFPLSGAAFLVDWLPPAAQSFVLLLPMVHAIEMLREGYFGPGMRAHYDIHFLAGTCAIQTLLGLALIQGAARRIRFA